METKHVRGSVQNILAYKTICLLRLVLSRTFFSKVLASSDTLLIAPTKILRETTVTIHVNVARLYIAVARVLVFGCPYLRNEDY